MDALESVRHDSAALCLFVDQIAASCKTSTTPSYTLPSKEFFAYIHGLGMATKAYLSQFVGALDSDLPNSDPDAFFTAAQQIRTLRFSWFRLHRFVKPALDADTLEVPCTLVEVLTDRLRQIGGFEKVRFAVVHTTELNYFQVTSSYIQGMADDISLIVPGAPPFPSDLGLIGIPYTQASSLFLNTALAHEMGHFAFDKRDEHTTFYKIVLAALRTSPSLQTLSARQNPTDFLAIQLCIDRCIGWLTEIYCDLFALFLIGPCFSIAYVELFALSRVRPVTPAGRKSSPIYALTEFSESHPADAVRLREHARFLRRPTIAWWEQIKESPSSHILLLEDSMALSDSDFALDSRIDSDMDKVALEVFLKLLPEVHSTIEGVFAGVDTEAKQFVEQKKAIQKYLSYGVVPSRLVDGDSICTPSTVALLNASSFFYLDEFNGLLDRIGSADSTCLECRSLWAQRIEMWTTKALEDVTQ